VALYNKSLSVFEKKRKEEKRKEEKRKKKRSFMLY